MQKSDKKNYIRLKKMPWSHLDKIQGISLHATKFKWYTFFVPNPCVCLAQRMRQALVRYAH